jgi:hypothetical protein
MKCIIVTVIPARNPVCVRSLTMTGLPRVPRYNFYTIDHSCALFFSGRAVATRATAAGPLTEAFDSVAGCCYFGAHKIHLFINPADVFLSRSSLSFYTGAIKLLFFPACRLAHFFDFLLACHSVDACPKPSTE